MNDAIDGGAKRQQRSALSPAGGTTAHPALGGMPRDESARHRPGNPREAKQELDRTRQEIQDTLGILKDRARDQVEEVRGRLDVLARARDRIRRDPMLLVGAAAGLGLLVGLLTGGRDSTQPAARLTEDEVDEIRAWRAERRHYLRRLERIMEDAVRGGKPTLRERLLDRVRHRSDEDDD